MYYAHKGSANDNAFTTFDGVPTRQFLAFATKEERQQAQEKIWQESRQNENLIFCDRKFVEKWNGKGFIVVKEKVYSSFDEVEE